MVVSFFSSLPREMIQFDQHACGCHKMSQTSTFFLLKAWTGKAEKIGKTNVNGLYTEIKKFGIDWSHILRSLTFVT